MPASSKRRSGSTRASECARTSSDQGPTHALTNEGCRSATTSPRVPAGRGQQTLFDWLEVMFAEFRCLCTRRCCRQRFFSHTLPSIPPSHWCKTPYHETSYNTQRWERLRPRLGNPRLVRSFETLRTRILEDTGLVPLVCAYGISQKVAAVVGASKIERKQLVISSGIHRFFTRVRVKNHWFGGCLVLQGFDAWKTTLVPCSVSSSAMIGGCKETVHMRCCRRLATSSAFTTKIAAWPLASKWRWAAADHSWHSERSRKIVCKWNWTRHCKSSNLPLIERKMYPWS